MSLKHGLNYSCEFEYDFVLFLEHSVKQTIEILCLHQMLCMICVVDSCFVLSLSVLHLFHGVQHNDGPKPSSVWVNHATSRRVSWIDLTTTAIVGDVAFMGGGGIIHSVYGERFNYILFC